MKFMKKLLSCVTSAEYAVMVAAFVAMVASYFISVLNRNFIQASMPWTEEIAIYSMTYMALLGTEVLTGQVTIQPSLLSELRQKHSYWQ